MMEDSQLIQLLESQKKKLEWGKATENQGDKKVFVLEKEGILQLEELQRGCQGLELPCLNGMIKSAAANNASEAIDDCVGMVMNLVSQKVIEFDDGVRLIVNLVLAYLKSRAKELDEDHALKLNDKAAEANVLNEKEDRLDRWETNQSRSAVELERKYQRMCWIIKKTKEEFVSDSGEKKARDITTTGHTSLEIQKKELELDEAPQNAEDEVALLEKQKFVLEGTYFELEDSCEDLHLKLASKKEMMETLQEAKSLSPTPVPAPESIKECIGVIMNVVVNEKVIALDEGFGVIKNLVHAYLKSLVEKRRKDHDLQLNEMDNLLNEMDHLLNEKYNFLKMMDGLVDEMDDLITKIEKLENEKLDLIKLRNHEFKASREVKSEKPTKKRTRSHVLSQDN